MNRASQISGLNTGTYLEFPYDSVPIQAMVVFHGFASEEFKGFHPVFKIVEFTLKITIIDL